MGELQFEYEGNRRGPRGRIGPQGLPGANAVANDAAVAAYISTAGSSDTLTALEHRFARVLTPEQFGAVGDGVTDDTAALVALVAALQDGDRIVGNPRRIYTHNDTLHVQDVSRIHWGGGAYQFTYAGASESGNAKAFALDGVHQSRFENMRIEQAVQPAECTGMALDACSDNIFDNVTAHNFRWIGFGVPTGSERNTFRDCVATRCRFGAWVHGRSSKIFGGRYSSEWSKTQEFVDKGGVWDTTSLYYDGIIIGGSDWVIDGATCDDNGQSGIYSGAAESGTISNCIVIGNWNKGIDLGTTSPGAIIDKMTVVGNIVKYSATGDISFANASSSVIAHNIVTTQSFGIGLNGLTQFNVVQGNIIFAAGDLYGVFVNVAEGEGVNNAILDNVIHGTTRPYLVDRSTNVVRTSVAGAQALQSTLRIDKTESTGYAGRALLALLTSDDNAFGQVVSNKPLLIGDGEGTPVEVTVGGLRSTKPITTQFGYSRPDPVLAGQGAMFYDASLAMPLWSSGAVWAKADGTPV